jgi:hypothetical protein
MVREVGLRCKVPKRRDGGMKKDRNIKEKTVIPVVVAGKVENLPKILMGRDLRVWPVF